MKWKAYAILLFFLLALVPVYIAFNWLRKTIVPSRSVPRLLLFILSGFTLVFLMTFLATLVARLLFPGA